MRCQSFGGRGCAESPGGTFSAALLLAIPHQLKCGVPLPLHGDESRTLARPPGGQAGRQARKRAGAGLQLLLLLLLVSWSAGAGAAPKRTRKTIMDSINTVPWPSNSLCTSHFTKEDLKTTHPYLHQLTHHDHKTSARPHRRLRGTKEMCTCSNYQHRDKVGAPISVVVPILDSHFRT